MAFDILLGHHKEADNINASRTYHCATNTDGTIPLANYLAGRVLVFSSSTDDDTINTNFVNVGNGSFAGVSMGLDSYRKLSMEGVDNPDISVVTNSNSVAVELADGYTAAVGDVVSYNSSGLVVKAADSGNDIIGIVKVAGLIGKRQNTDGSIANNVPTAIIRLDITRIFGVTGGGNGGGGTAPDLTELTNRVTAVETVANDAKTAAAAAQTTANTANGKKAADITVDPAVSGGANVQAALTNLAAAEVKSASSAFNTNKPKL